jgi:hypothetical protein
VGQVERNHNSVTAGRYNTNKEDTNTWSGQVDDACWEEAISKINFKDEILNIRILMNINKIRLQRNLVDNNTKIMNMKAHGKWGKDIQYSLTVLAYEETPDDGQLGPKHVVRN